MLAAGVQCIPAAAAVPGYDAADMAALEALVSAEFAEYNGDARRALAEWQRLAVLVPDLPDMHENMMRHALAAGDYISAEKHALSLWNGGNYLIDARVVLLSAAVKRGDWKAAQRFTTEALDDLQKRVWERMFAPILHGWIAVGRRDRAAVLAAMPADNAIVHPTMRGHEGLMLLALGDKRGAAAVADALRPTDRISQIAAAQLVLELQQAGLKREADALRARVRLLDDGQSDPELALPARRVNNPAAGLAHWFAPMAASFARTSDLASPFGETLARSALTLDGQHWGARLMLAKDYQSYSRYDEALALLGNKKNMPPLARLLRAEILLEKGEVAAAMAEADLAIAGSDVPRDLLISHTDFVRKMKDPAKSEQALERLRAHLTGRGDDPQLQALILVSLADLRLKSASWEEVLPLIEHAVALAPNDASVLNFAGYSGIERRQNLTYNMKLIAQAAGLEPDNASIIDSLGWAHHLLGQNDIAVTLLEQAWRGQSDNAVIAEHLGDAYFHVGRKFEARHIWRAASLLADDEMMLRLEPKLRFGWSAETAAP
jgi:tetratricopeptide (TPR) repeat protein